MIARGMSAFKLCLLTIVFTARIVVAKTSLYNNNINEENNDESSSSFRFLQSNAVNNFFADDDVTINAMNGRAIDIVWCIPPMDSSYDSFSTSLKAKVGDTLKFLWEPKRHGHHHVSIYPSNSCNDNEKDRRIFLGYDHLGSTTYTFTNEDIGKNVTFSCDINNHCILGQIITFEVLSADTEEDDSSSTITINPCDNNDTIQQEGENNNEGHEHGGGDHDHDHGESHNDEDNEEEDDEESEEVVVENEDKEKKNGSHDHDHGDGHGHDHGSTSTSVTKMINKVIVITIVATTTIIMGKK